MVTCSVCGGKEKVVPLLMPWRKDEGWHTCQKESCKQKVTSRIYTMLDQRRVIGTLSLPDWFRDWGLFDVRRSDGSLSEMVLVDFACAFSKNEQHKMSANVYEGRVKLHEDDLFIDMCNENHTAFKQVKLSNLYENNPDLLRQGKFVVNFPPYVTDESRKRWMSVIDNILREVKKKIEDPPATEDTDDESRSPTPVPIPSETEYKLDVPRLESPPNMVQVVSPLPNASAISFWSDESDDE